MSTKKNISIKIAANTEQAVKGIDKVSKQIDTLANKTKKNPIVNFTNSFNSLTRAASFVTKAIKSAAAAVNDTIEAYSKQAEAETQLEAAARNNPYLNTASVQRLKDYASQLQSISTVGDEELLPMMAQLAAAGRTQAEIQDIMSASVDIAASGTMSLESAVKNLNKTYSGLSGELGEANPAIKSLTKEQLKNGEAVKVMQQQYGGIARSVADATGGWKQFQNTLGDLKEAIGQNFAETKNSAGKILNTFFSGIISKIQEASTSAEDFRRSLGLIASSGATAQSSSKEIQGEIDTLNAQLEKLGNVKKFAVDNALDDYKKQLDSRLEGLKEDQKKEIDSLNEELEKTAFRINNVRHQQGVEFQLKGETSEYDRLGNELTELEKKEDSLNERIKERKSSYDTAIKAAKESKATAEKEASDAEYSFIEGFNSSKTALENKITEIQNDIAKKQAELSAALKREQDEDSRTEEQKVLDLYSENHKARQQEIDDINRKYALMEAEGRQTDENAKKKEVLAAYEKAYQSLITTDRTLITENNSKAKKDLEEIIRLYKELYGDIELPEFTLDTSSSIEEQKKQLEDYKNILQSMLEDVDKESEAYKTLTKAIKETDEAIKSLSASAKDWGDLTVWEKLEFAEKQLSSLASSIDSALSLTAETMDNEASAALSNLESQYAQGLVSEEDYYDKKDKIEQDSARKKYKIELATWAMNLASTQSAAALAIANSLKDGGTLGMIQAAVMGVQTAVQLAAQIAAKPVPPSFASGGVVGGFQGASTGGDNTYIHARNGEMMLNAAQQRNLFDVANSRMGGGVKWNITVNNEAGDVASASATASDDGIQIAVKKIVSEAMAGGELNDSYQAMRAGIYGRRITS